MMKCKIVRYEVYIWIWILIHISILSTNCAPVSDRYQTIQELCTNKKNSFSVKPDETELLRLTASRSPGLKESKFYQKYKRKCRTEFTTNNGDSHLFIVISNMTIPSCSEKCHCNYFEIGENKNEGGLVSEQYCGSSREEIYFESKNEVVYIDFHHSPSMQFDVTITLTVRRNSYLIEGSPSLRRYHFLETPYFPNAYRTDYTAEYILQSTDGRSQVMLMFLDFQIATKSLIEVTGHNGTHPGIFYGNRFRPPVFISQRHQLTLKFVANRHQGSGFRAAYYFLRDSDLKDQVPSTNCGGLKEGYGGVISLSSVDKAANYDCIWHVSPPIFSGNTFYLSVANIRWENIAPPATLEFREGLLSKSQLVRSISCDTTLCSFDEITVSASTGLYIRFNGLIGTGSVLNMTYSTYRHGNCSEEGGGLVCNEKCLLESLRCDGVQNCPDGSDEQDCYSTPSDPLVVPLSPVSRLHHPSTATAFVVVLSVGVVGMVVMVVVFVVVMWRIQRKRSNAVVRPEERQSVVSELTGPLPLLSSHSPDQPPSYDDFIRSSAHYPPLLFLHAPKRSTTSFCHMPPPLPPRRVAAHSFDLHSLSSSGSGSCIRSDSDRSSLFGATAAATVEWCLKPPGLKKSASLETVLPKSTSCHVHLSISHSVCCKSHSLPTNMRVREIRPNGVDVEFQQPACRFCSDSARTTVKARCFSDPCRSRDGGLRRPLRPRSSLK